MLRFIKRFLCNHFLNGGGMASIYDVADWFLSKEPMSHKKVQKLCYYFKAWGLALYDGDFLPDYEFQAWVHGPVNMELYQKYKSYGWNDIPQEDDNSEKFTEREKSVLESVWDTYGDLSANALEALTHKEEPWGKARGDCEEFQNCEVPISNEEMKRYYRALYERNQGD